MESMDDLDFDPELDSEEAPGVPEEGPYGHSVVVKVSSLIVDLVPGYLESRRMELEQIRELIRVADFEHLKVIGHRLKGSGAGYGFDEITVLGGIIEAASVSRDLHEVTRAARRLAAYVDVVTFTTDD